MNAFNTKIRIMTLNIRFRIANNVTVDVMLKVKQFSLAYYSIHLFFFTDQWFKSLSYAHKFFHSFVSIVT